MVTKEQQIGMKLAAALLHAKVSVADVAEACEVSPQAVYKWLRTGQIAREHLPKLAQLTGITTDALLNEKSAIGVREPLSDYATLRDVRIVGYAQGGIEDGYFEEVSDGDSSVSFNTRDDAAYALIVKGDSMSPRIRSGEIIVVTPGRQPHPGDDVIVATVGGKKMAKHYLYRRNGSIALGSINEAHSIITLPETEIQAIHYIAGRLPSSAIRDLTIKDSKEWF